MNFSANLGDDMKVSTFCPYCETELTFTDEDIGRDFESPCGHYFKVDAHKHIQETSILAREEEDDAHGKVVQESKKFRS